MVKVNRAPIGGLNRWTDFESGEMYEHLESGKIFLCVKVMRSLVVQYTEPVRKNAPRYPIRDDRAAEQMLVDLESGEARVLDDAARLTLDDSTSRPYAGPHGPPGLFRHVRAAEIRVAFNGQLSDGSHVEAVIVDTPHLLHHTEKEALPASTESTSIRVRR